MGDPASISSALASVSPAVQVLMDKIDRLIAGIFRPFQIRRVAQAEADAQLIATKTQVEIGELRQRALWRFLDEESRKQVNMEAVVQKALPEVDGKSDPTKVEDDWITNFFDKCRLTSDEEMQTLWAKILAGEANSPGTYSKRTVTALASFDKEDARQFSTVCRFAWDLGYPAPLILAHRDPIYAAKGITFSLLTHLDSIGLLKFDGIQSHHVATTVPSAIAVHLGKAVMIGFDKSKKLPLGHALFTQMGKELCRIVHVEPVDGFFDYVVAAWRTSGLTVTPIGGEPARQFEASSDKPI